MCNAGTLVGKDRLFDVAWPDQTVSEAVPTTAIREIRRALEDNARIPGWIETQHGKGYRFLPPVAARAVHPGRQSAGEPSDAAFRKPSRTLQASRRWMWPASTAWICWVSGSVRASGDTIAVDINIVSSRAKRYSRGN